MSALAFSQSWLESHQQGFQLDFAHAPTRLTWTDPVENALPSLFEIGADFSHFNLKQLHNARSEPQNEEQDMTKRYIVDVDGVPSSPSPISNAVVVGNQCWISGQLSIGDDGAYVPGSTIEEARRAFAHVFRIAEAAGFSATDIVYVDLAFIDLADVKAVNGLYAELFPEGQRPARTIYQAAALPFGGRIKVQAVAAR
ncbi:putative aminoacrylate peracid reductase RutC [compost metagenome]